MATQSTATSTHLPQWQPDETAVACPLCNTVFSWWYRKHHCRRCARVVCGACAGNFCLLKASAVVRPPGQAPFSLATATSQSLWSSTLHDRPGSAGSATGRPASILSSSADTAVEEVRCCDACFSQLEQDRSRRMLGLDIAHLDPRTAAQLIRELATTGGAPSPSAAEARTGTGAGGGTAVALGTPPPCYSQAPAAQASTLTQTETASQHVAIAPQGGQRVRQGHRRRHPDSGASAFVPLDSALQLPSSSPVVPLRYVTFQLTLSDKILGEECPICFEEYEEGQLAARLECWCVFHEGCIKAWRDTKDGTHGCPLHFHD